MPSPRSDENLRARALELIAGAWDVARDMEGTPLDAINRVRPPDLRYGRQEDLVREWVAVAGAISTFAVQMGLITPADDADLRRGRSDRET